MEKNKQTGFSCKRLRDIRKHKNLTQLEVAKGAEISRLAYSNIENGKSQPREETLRKISEVLKVSVEDLVSNSELLSSVRFRANHSFVNRISLVSSLISRLSSLLALEAKLVNLHGSPTIPAKQLPFPPTIPPKDLARSVRKELEIDFGPILDICECLWLFGIKVLPIDHPDSNFFGLSIGQASGGPAVVVNINPKISVERWIFTLAHELGHIFLHQDSFDIEKEKEDSDQEKEANEFASYFLLPEEDLKSFLEEINYRLSWPNLMKFKRTYRISAKTVIYRMNERQEDGSLWKWYYKTWKTVSGKSHSQKDEPEPLWQEKENDDGAPFSKELEGISVLAVDFHPRIVDSICLGLDSDLINMDEAVTISGLKEKDIREIRKSTICLKDS